MKSFRIQLLFSIFAALFLLQSCGSGWNNFNKRKHLNLKSKEVYTEVQQEEDVVIYDEVASEIPDLYSEVEHFSSETTLSEENEVVETYLSEEDVSYEVETIKFDEQLEEDPAKAKRIKDAKIEQLRKDTLKFNKWSWIAFVPFVICIALIGVLFFVVNLANPVAEVLYVLSIFAGLTMILGFVSSARSLTHAKRLKKLSDAEEDQAFAKKMINKTVTMMVLYLLFPALLISGLFIFAE